MSNLKLIKRQEGFCQSYLETVNATEAYRRHYKTDNMKPCIVEKKVCELKKKGKVGRATETASGAP